MEKEAIHPSKKTRFKGRFLSLLIILLLFIAVSPFFEGFTGIKMLFDIFISTIFIYSIYILAEKKYQVLIGILLAIPMIVSIWSVYFVQFRSIIVIGRLCGILFMALLIINILSHIFKRKEVDIDVIAGAASVYLLMAIMWAFIYGLIEKIHPGSFAVSGTLQASSKLFLYYSFVTITTLGYGDITPLTEIANSASILEAVVGQLYLVIQVARLVGMHVSQSMNRNSTKS